MRDAGSSLAPPAIEILLREKFPHDVNRLRRRFSRSSLIRDLHHQALASLDSYTYYKAGGDDFAVVPASSLDPLSRIRPCPHPDCLSRSVADLGRTLAVYSDVVVLPDNVTPLVAGMSDDSLTDEQAFQLFTSAFSLQLLQPLIAAGVVRFFFGEQVMCRRHMQMFDRSVERVAKKTATAVLPQTDVAITDDGFTITNQSLFSPLRGYEFRSASKAAQKRLQKADELNRRATTGLADQLRQELRETALEMYSAEHASATYILESPLIASALSAQKRDSILPQPRRTQQLSTLRLPWVADLTLPEVLELRETTKPALQRLRTLLRKSLQGGSSHDAITADLRDQAAEVEAELSALPLARNRQFRYAAAGLGLVLSVVAAATGPFPSAAVGAGGSLLSVLSLLHGTESNDSHKVAQLRTKPGYVLLRAKELVERRAH